MSVVALRRIEVFASAVRTFGFINARMASVRRAPSRHRSKIISLRLREKGDISLRIASSHWEVRK